MNWITNVPLSSIAEVALGRQRSPQHAEGPFMVKYLRAANVKDGRLDLSNVLSMNFTPNEQQVFGLVDGDVLVTEGSGSLSSVGASAAWHNDIPETVCFQNTLLRMRPRSKICDGRFLAWWARSAYASGLFASLAGGANIYHLSADRVRAIRLNLPPLDTQRSIANFLDAETSRIDSVIAKRVRQKILLDERLYADISETLIPGITHAHGGQSPWPWLPEVPHDRPLVRLGYLCRLQTGITVDATRHLIGDTVTRPYLRVTNVQAGHVELSSVAEVTVPIAMATRSTLLPGDVLMTEGGDLDKLGRGTVWRGEIPDCLHQNHVFALRPYPDRLDSDYLALLTRSLHGRCYFESTGSKTTNLASTSSSKIADFPVPLPGLTLQRKLVDELNKMADTVSLLMVTLDRQITLLTERRSAMIMAAVAGTIDVSTASGRRTED